MSADLAVVVPYYDQQPQLDRLLAALEHQRLDPARLEVVVADDGSPRPPVLGRRSYAVRTVRQDDLGFRASAARDLGARATDAPVLCFLDADMVPEPDYLSRLTRVVGAGPCGTVAVGHRRHADLSARTPDDVHRWLSGGRAPDPLPEPQWLADGYRQTDDLRRADDRSYRFVISAVLAMTRELAMVHAREGIRLNSICPCVPSTTVPQGPPTDAAHAAPSPAAPSRRVSAFPLVACFSHRTDVSSPAFVRSLVPRCRRLAALPKHYYRDVPRAQRS